VRIYYWRWEFIFEEKGVSKISKNKNHSKITSYAVSSAVSPIAAKLMKNIKRNASVMNPVKCKMKLIKCLPKYHLNSYYTLFQVYAY